MDAPIPTSETVETAYEHVTERIAALKAHKPQTQAEQRRRATEMASLKQAQLDLAKQVINENAAQRIAEAIGEDHAKPMNGSNGHAPINQPNWAQLIAEAELRFETKFATLKEKSGGGLTDEELDGLARGMVPFLRETIAKAVNPLLERIAELEAKPTMQYQGIFDPQKSYVVGDFCTERGSVWHCNTPCIGSSPGSATGVWTLAVKHGRDLRK